MNLRELLHEYNERFAHFDITVTGSIVTIDCMDEHCAKDLAYSIGLVLADRSAGWTHLEYSLDDN